ncbi:MAG: DUF4235 domain-containing protein, partial [Frankiaceae bacterium]|nr:DUF4235 domain-containing protein [Frankiaceae bacterium]
MAKRDKPGVATVPPTDDDSEKNAGKLGYKVLAGASAAIGTTVARKAIDTTWRKATGKEPPTNPEHPDIKWAEAATWAAASAA